MTEPAVPATSAATGQAPPGDVVVALDVGGTGMKCALVRPDGRVAHTERHHTRAERGPAAVVESILDVAEGLAGKARADGLTPVAVGLAVPGVVDETTGRAVWSANLGFRDVPLRELVIARLGLPAALGHDVRVGGLAEARLGAGRGTRHVLFLAIGTGIAAAHVVDGSAFGGAHGAAGELGHVVVRPDGPRCGCGRLGCLEAVASAAAVGRRYATLTGIPATAAEVVARAAGGEETAARVWRETIDALADGLAIAQALYDTEVVVLGGGLAEAGADLLDPLGVALRQRLTFQTEPRLLRAALGDEAGSLGAALLALDTLNRP
ncbi:ROK family protein [Plantactinospora sp. KLBMP9567]|uniref:ROK family protein n=1 Tax=Plantactinospora sp. KLBMP9567 TaxID=3085900 RepID=UPI002981FB79|nr:ROK family protein [Plantactinospora sp. KLBMP9567]MDW5325427.1 ROK family protein [Plantactinospora sp. KLBMP9567]